MITSYISSNTIFFTKSEQQAFRPVLYTLFIPFTPFFIPVYTRLYLKIKHINIAHTALQLFCPFKLYPSAPFFQNYTPAPR